MQKYINNIKKIEKESVFQSTTALSRAMEILGGKNKSINNTLLKLLRLFSLQILRLAKNNLSVFKVTIVLKEVRANFGHSKKINKIK